MAQFTVGTNFKSPARVVPIGGTIYEFDLGLDTEFKVPAGSTNLEFDFEMLHAKIAAYCLSLGTQSASQAAANPPSFSEATAGELVVKVNSITTPAPTITVDAKIPHAFATAIQGSTNEFSADVTSFFISNAGSTDLFLLVSVGLNS